MAGFYVMSDNQTGVVVFPTVGGGGMDLYKEMLELQTGFGELEDRGIKKVSDHLSKRSFGYRKQNDFKTHFF